MTQEEFENAKVYVQRLYPLHDVVLASSSKGDRFQVILKPKQFVRMEFPIVEGKLRGVGDPQ